MFPRGWPEIICPSPGLRAYLPKLAVEVIHSHGLWLRPLHYAHRHSRQRGIPHVISPRGMMTRWAWHHHRWQKTLAECLIHPGALKEAQGWHATSEAEADDIRRLGFQQPICVAPNGVDAPTAAELENATAYWREACPQAFQQPTALFYSRLHQKKRVLELIDLWLEHAPREWLLLVVGVPQTYTIGELASYVHRESAYDRVKVFDGTATPPPYVAASLFLLPSHSENFGLVIAEALAHGLPALVTDTTPWQSLHTKGYGWCIPWERFTETMGAALSEGPDRLRQRGLGARAWAMEAFSWTQCARQLAAFYAQLRSSSS